MFEPAPSLDEQARLAALYACEILDTMPESAFEDLVALAQQVCATPAAAITFIDSERQWIKAGRGMGDANNIPRQHTFCTYAIGNSRPLVVPDATQDTRFANNPFVTADMGVRFYAGVPLVLGEGAHVGTLCVLDRSPRVLDLVAQSTLELIARQVASQLELRRQRVALQAQLAETETAMRHLTLAYALQQCMAQCATDDAGLGQAIGIICEALGCAAGGIWWVADTGDVLVNRGGYWTSDARQAAFARASLDTVFRPGMGLPGTVWRSGSTLWLEDVLSEPSVPRLTAALASGLVSGVGVPLAIDGKVVAVIELFSTQRFESETESRALLTLATQELVKSLVWRARLRTEP